jgi:transposase
LKAQESDTKNSSPVTGEDAIKEAVEAVRDEYVRHIEGLKKYAPELGPIDAAFTAILAMIAKRDLYERR